MMSFFARKRMQALRVQQMRQHGHANPGQVIGSMIAGRGEAQHERGGQQALRPQTGTYEEERSRAGPTGMHMQQYAANMQREAAERFRGVQRILSSMAFVDWREVEEGSGMRREQLRHDPRKLELHDLATIYAEGLARGGFRNFKEFEKYLVNWLGKHGKNPQYASVAVERFKKHLERNNEAFRNIKLLTQEFSMLRAGITPPSME